MPSKVLVKIGYCDGRISSSTSISLPLCLPLCNSLSKLAILLSFAKQSSHENIRGPGAQNDSALFIASSGDRRLRPRVFCRTTCILQVWGRCFPLHASQLVPTTSPPLASPPLACIANDYCARGNAWGNAWGNAGEIGISGTVLYW